MRTNRRTSWRAHWSVQHALVLLTTAPMLGGCSEQSLTLGGDLALTVSTNAPISVSDSLVVEYDATGRSLVGLILDYGDAAVDSLPFRGAQTAGGRVAHLYGDPGQYTLSARVEDIVEGALTEQRNVVVDP